MISAQSFRIGGYVIAIGLLALGAFIITGAATMRVSPIYVRSGPQLFPYLVGGLVLIVGVSALREAIAGRLAPDSELELDLMPPLYMAGGLMLQILTIRHLGWIVSATLLFMAGARAFRKDAPLLDLLIGLALAIVTYFMFDRWLGLRLPAGSLFFG